MPTKLVSIFPFLIDIEISKKKNLCVMRILGFKCTIPCKELLALELRMVKTIVYIKEFPITFNCVFKVIMLIHVNIEEIPKSYDMPLGREWSTKFK